MHFSTTNHFNGDTTQVIAALNDPAFYEWLDDLPDLATPEVVAHQSGRKESSISVRYRYIGNVDGFVKRLIGNEPLSWVQHTTFDLSSETAQFEIESEVASDLLRCNGTMELLTTEGGSVRNLEADLDVRIPLISGKVAGKLIPGIISRIDAEAGALDFWLDSNA